MKRAIVVTIVVAVVALAAVLILTWGQPSELRPAQETKRHAPGTTAGGFEPGTEAPPVNAAPDDG